MCTLFLTTAYSRNTRGFTLVELIVSVGIFSVVMLVAVSALLTVVDANRKSQTLALTMNNLDFALDHLFREISTGQSYYCIETPSGITTEESYELPTGINDCSTGGVGIALTNDNDYRVQFEFYEGQLWRNLAGGGWTPITAEEVIIEDMLFYVNGADGADGVQPHVNVLIKGRADAPRISSSDFDIQTLVVQRTLDR